MDAFYSNVQRHKALLILNKNLLFKIFLYSTYLFDRTNYVFENKQAIK